MSRGALARVFVVILFSCALLYSYVDKQNEVTRLRLEIPVLAKEIKEIKEQNTRLHYEIEIFESPQRLMELARHSEFGHLKHPMLKEVITMQEGIALHPSSSEKESAQPSRPKLPLAIGLRP
jgi:hypothetical protein